jgi:hypothetical protein
MGDLKIRICGPSFGHQQLPATKYHSQVPKALLTFEWEVVPAKPSLKGFVILSHMSL